MRPFFMTVGVLAWLWAFAVMWIFADRGGVLTVIAAGVFAIVAIIALACERILKLLEDIRERMFTHVRRTAPPSKRATAVSAVSMLPAADPATTLL